MAFTIGGLLGEARGLLSDTVAVGPVTRYSDTDLINAFNVAMAMARTKRPDLFLDIGLRNAVPQYAMPNDAATVFPLDPGVYPAFLYFIVGHAEMRDDTFADDKRAETLMNKFVALLLQVAS